MASGGVDLDPRVPGDSGGAEEQEEHKEEQEEENRAFEVVMCLQLVFKFFQSFLPLFSFRVKRIRNTTSFKYLILNI